MNNRRSFIKKIGLAGVLLSSGQLNLNAFVNDDDFFKLTILHTNDVHSRVEPFPMDGGRNEGKGGVVPRAELIKKIRRAEKNVLLLDAGDIFQGTPYFNYFGGELELKLMSKMGYDAATIGNHDFDGGIDGLKKQLPHANFPILISNYDFTDTIMNGKTQNHKVFHMNDGIKIGVFGVGIELEGLVPKDLFTNTIYLDPLKVANEQARILKKEKKCDYVICLSHLGFKYRSRRICDITLAEESENIDLIIGGHTHTFLKKPNQIKNKAGGNVLVNQAGWAGILLGRLDIVFEKNKTGKMTSGGNILIN